MTTSRQGPSLFSELFPFLIQFCYMVQHFLQMLSMKYLIYIRVQTICLIHVNSLYFVFNRSNKRVFLILVASNFLPVSKGLTAFHHFWLLKFELQAENQKWPLFFIELASLPSRGATRNSFWSCSFIIRILTFSLYSKYVVVNSTSS